MANPIIEQLLAKQYIRIQRDIEESLLQVDALLQFALNGSFLEQPRDVLHDYLWALSNLLDKAKESNRIMLDLLCDDLLW